MFLNLFMSTAPECPGRVAEMKMVRVKSNELQLGCLVTQVLPLVNAKGKYVYLEGELPHPKTDIQSTVGFYLSMHFQWTFTEHFSTFLHRPTLSIKDGFAASRMCWYFTNIDTKIGVLMIHQYGDSTISSQHLKRNKTRLKIISKASKKLCTPSQVAGFPKC